MSPVQRDWRYRNEVDRGGRELAAVPLLGSEDDMELVGQPAGETPKKKMGGVELKQQLGLISTTSYVIGTMIGSGIFISPTGIINHVQHDPGVSLLVWVICGFICLLASFTSIEWGVRVPRSGGAYLYILEAWGHLPSFIFIWAQSCLIQPCGTAVVALTMSTYLVQPVLGIICGQDADETPPKEVLDVAEPLVATITLLLLAYLNARSVSMGATLQVATTIGKVLGLVVIIVAGFVHLSGGAPSGNTFSLSFRIYDNVDVGELVLALYAGMWAYGGWDSPNAGLAEVKNVKRTLPLALLLGVSTVCIIYLLTNISYFSALSPEQVTSSTAVGLTFSRVALPPYLTWIVPTAVIVSVLGNMNSAVWAMSRQTYAASTEGHYPSVLGMLDVDTNTPTPAIIINTLAAIIYLWLLDIFELLNFLSFVFWLCQASLAAGLVYVRLKYKSSTTLSTLQYPLIIHVVFGLVALFLGGVPFITEWRDVLKGVSLVMLGVPLYLCLVWGWRGGPDPLLSPITRKPLEILTTWIQLLLRVASPQSMHSTGDISGELNSAVSFDYTQADENEENEERL